MIQLSNDIQISTDPEEFRTRKNAPGLEAYPRLKALLALRERQREQEHERDKEMMNCYKLQGRSYASALPMNLRLKARELFQNRLDDPQTAPVTKAFAVGVLEVCGTVEVPRSEGSDWVQWLKGAA